MATETSDPISDAIEADARRVVANLAMLDARDVANRCMAHALDLRQKVGGPVADAAADTFEERAAQFRQLERSYAAEAGISEL